MSQNVTNKELTLDPQMQSFWKLTVAQILSSLCTIDLNKPSNMCYESRKY